MTQTEYDKQILAALDTQGGFTTGQVAKKVLPRFGHNARTHSGAVRSCLEALERQGVVARLDEQKPMFWIKTAAGTEIE